MPEQLSPPAVRLSLSIGSSEDIILTCGPVFFKPHLVARLVQPPIFDGQFVLFQSWTCTTSIICHISRGYMFDFQGKCQVLKRKSKQEAESFLSGQLCVFQTTVGECLNAAKIYC